MDERILWEKFKKTGRINDYLAYAKAKKEAVEYKNHCLGNVK